MDFERVETATTIWLKYKGASMGDYNYKHASVPANANNKTVSSKAGVLTNENGSANIVSVKSTNGKKNANKKKNNNRQ